MRNSSRLKYFAGLGVVLAMLILTVAVIRVTVNQISPPKTTFNAANMEEINPIVWDNFFTDIQMVPEMAFNRGSSVIRQRAVKTTVDVFSGLAVVGDAPVGVPISINLELFDNLVLQTEEMKLSKAMLLTDGLVLTGKIVGEEYSEVVLVSNGQILEGHIILGDQLYQITSHSEGINIISQIDLSAMPADLHVPIPEESLEAGRSPSIRLNRSVRSWLGGVAVLPNSMLAVDTSQLLQSSDSVIDIMIVYTANADARKGNILAQLDAEVASLNLSLENSGVNTTVRLVHAVQTDYTEVGNVNDLYQITDGSDGFMDEIHLLRDQYKADLVSLIVSENSPYCGVAWMISRPENSFYSRYAFSVIEWDCMGGSFSFLHEAGHNMGNMHDIDNSANPGSFEYSYGYQDPNNQFRTIMAYSCPNWCPRLRYWSSPNLSYNGLPLGIADQADNVRSMNNNAIWVSLFREIDTALATPTLELITPTSTLTATPTEYSLTPSSTPISQTGDRIAHQTNGGPTLTDSDIFGWSVTAIGDLDGDGIQDLAAGAPGDDTGGMSRGAIYILFMNRDGTVRELAKIADSFNDGPELATGNSLGYSLTGLGDLNGDGTPDLGVGAFAANGGRGEIYIFFLNSNGTVKNHTLISDNLNGGPALAVGDTFGTGLASIGDLNHDGVIDLAVGARLDDTGGENRGAVYILFMNPNGTAASSVKIAHNLNGGPTLADTDFFGESVARIGDLNGDGNVDLAVGALGDNTSPDKTNNGAVHILFMNSDGTVLASNRIAQGYNGGPPTETNAHDFAAEVSNVGDIDQDGFPDVLVGQPYINNGEGRLVLLNLNPDGSAHGYSVINIPPNNGSSGPYFGRGLANIGDLNGDGTVDLAVGAIGDDTGGVDRGALYILFDFGSPSASSTPTPQSSSTPAYTATATSAAAATPTPTPQPVTSTPAPTSTSIPAATSTPIPTATSTPIPTATEAVGEETSFEAMLETLDEAWENGDITNKGVYLSLRQLLLRAQESEERGNVDLAIQLLELFIDRLDHRSVSQETAELLEEMALLLITQIE